MMLVSSSGWAHSPITLIFTALSAVYGDGGAAAPGIAIQIATVATLARIAPLSRTRKRFLDRTSVPPSRTTNMGSTRAPHARPAPVRAASDDEAPRRLG